MVAMLLVVMGSGKLWATHIYGADISYTVSTTNSNLYEVVVNVYTNCAAEISTDDEPTLGLTGYTTQGQPNFLGAPCWEDNLLSISNFLDLGVVSIMPPNSMGNINWPTSLTCSSGCVIGSINPSATNFFFVRHFKYKRFIDISQYLSCIQAPYSTSWPGNQFSLKKEGAFYFHISDRASVSVGLSPSVQKVVTYATFNLAQTNSQNLATPIVVPTNTQSNTYTGPDVAFACPGTYSATNPHWINPTFQNVDGDAVTFNLSDAYGLVDLFPNAFTSLIPIPTYSAPSSPISAFGTSATLNIDPVTGRIELTGTITSGLYAFGINSTEQTNGIPILTKGTTHREMLVLVDNAVCVAAQQNQAPIIGAIQNASQGTYVVGDTIYSCNDFLQFQVSATDPQNDIISLSAIVAPPNTNTTNSFTTVSNVPGASSGILSISGLVAGSLYKVLVTATDNACMPNTSTRVFVIKQYLPLVANKTLAPGTPNPIIAGVTNFTYNITITNPNPFPVSNVVVRDAIPSILAYAGVSGVAGMTINTLPSSANNNTLIAIIPKISGGTTVTVNVNAKANCYGVVTNCATVNIGLSGNCGPQSCITHTIMPNTAATPIVFQGPVTLYSAVVNSIPINGANIMINGTLIVDVSLNLMNATLRFTEGSSLVVSMNQTAHFVGGILQGLDCGNMWGGVRVESGGTLNLDFDVLPATIRDAEYGVYLVGGATLSARRWTFTRNFIGIFAEAISSTNKTVNTNINACTFDVYSPMVLGKYPGQASKPIMPKGTSATALLQPYAGIYAKGVTGFTIGTSGFNPSFYNLFLGGTSGSSTAPAIKGLSYAGIVAENSTVTVVHSQFRFFDSTAKKNLVYTYPYATNGRAIVAKGGQSNTLTVLGFTPVTTPSFLSCYTGIFSDGVNITVQNTVMHENRTGIIVQLANACKIDLTKNTILNSSAVASTGIRLSSNDLASFISVTNNTISIQPSGQNPPTAMAAIAVDETGMRLKKSAYLLKNICTIGRCYTGISLQGATGWTLSENTVNMPVTAQLAGNAFQRGIAINGTGQNQNGGNNYIGFNTVTNTAAAGANGPQKSAFAIFASDKNTYECNTAAKADTGFLFVGTCNAPDAFKGNTMNLNKTDLRIGNSGIIGQQRLRGNKWVAGNGKVENVYSGGPGLSLFYINGSGTIPPGYTTVPASINPGSQLWFKPQAGTNITCGTPQPIANGGGPISGSGITALHALVAEGNFWSEWYPEATERLVHSELFAMIQADTTLKSYSAAVANCYDSLRNTSVADFYRVQNYVHQLYPEQADSLLTLWQADVAVLLTQKLALDSLLIAATDADSAYLMQQRDSLVAALATNESLIAQREQTFETLRQQNVQAVRTANGYITPQSLYDQNQQTITDIYLSTIATGIDSFNEEQLQQLASIAQQCPLAGGPSVFWARSLYAMVVDTVWYDDYGTCFEQGIQLKPIKTAPVLGQSASYLTLAPNPAQEKLTLSYQVEEDAMLTLYNTIGTVVLQVPLVAKLSEISLEVGHLPAGVYFYSVPTVNNILSGKVVITQ